MLGVSGIISSTSGDGGPESGGGGAVASGGSSEVANLGGNNNMIAPSSGGHGFNITEEDNKLAAIRMEEAAAAGERNNTSGGNRWPRQETIALLKIRSEMDVIFRDSTLKGPLWDEVSRKMAGLGYHRSAKKCKEKFENVFKYHKRTKDGRASKSDGKTYRFFEHLEALENNPSSHRSLLLPPNSSRPPPPPLEATPINMAMPMPTANATINVQQGPITSQGNVTVSSAPHNNPFATSQNTASHHQNVHNITFSSSMPQPPSQPSPQQPPNPINNPQVNTSFPSHQNFYSTSSSTSSDEDIQRRHKKKRKWKDFFERLMKDVIDRQEELQRRFLETLEKWERDRLVREEAWRVQEMARMNREHDLLLQERSMAAAKDAAVIAFLQKVSEQQNIQIPNNINVTRPAPQVQIQLPENPPAAPTHSSQQQQQQTQPITFTVSSTLAQPVQAPVAVSLPTTIPPPVPAQSLPQPLPPPVPPKNMEAPKSDNGGEGYNTPGVSSSRWPKAEVQALIMLRTNLDVKYQENGPKGPLWEEISGGMRKLGYNRNAKRCKEKWENINKYFKKVKESNKRRPEDSKTCPYFHQLDALYKEKAKHESSSSTSFNPSASGFELNPAENNPMAPIMARPENQWPLPQHQHQQQQRHETPMDHDHDHDHESDNMNEDEEEEEEDEDEENAYEIVTNKQQSSMTGDNTINTTTTTTTSV